MLEIKSVVFRLFLTDATLCFQLVVFAKHVYYSGSSKEKFLFCSSFATATNVSDIL